MTARDLRHLQSMLAQLIAGQQPRGEPTREGELERLVKPSARGMDPQARLAVYREQFWTRHLENLRDDFPTLIWAMGGSAPFRAFATEYLIARPPRGWDLQRLGDRLPEHLAATPRWNSDRLAKDAARLDWAFMEAFDCADAAPVDPTVLASIPEDVWPSATVTLHPSLRLLEMDHPVHLARSELSEGRTPERPPMLRTFVAVWRDRSCTRHACPLEPAAFAILAGLNAGLGLGVACESAMRRTSRESVETSVGPWFQDWSARGWISAVTPPSHDD